MAADSPTTGDLFLTKGARVRDYQLARRLGQGGFGEVWEAVKDSGFRHALKFIDLKNKNAHVEARSLEIVKSKGLGTPNLLEVFDSWQQDTTLVIAMELCDQSLLQCLREAQRHNQKGIPIDELLVYMFEAAKGIDFLNAHGIQHRDIKPQNLMLKGGGVKVADYGLAKLLEAAQGDHSNRGMSVAYAAPEFFQSKFTDRSDQYSLAISYCELRTGAIPFKGSNAANFMYAHLFTDPDLSDLPEEERPVVRRALEKEPDKRFAACKDFVQALSEAHRPATTVKAGTTVSGDNFLVLHEGGTYQLTKRIGSGAFGQVWKAVAPDGIEVAVKIVSLPDDAEEAKQELKALELIKNTRHNFLLQTLSYRVNEDQVFIVMELADRSLRDRLKECGGADPPCVPLAELLGYMYESAEALDYLHVAEVHHLDIKPENILLLGKHVKLADFGQARRMAGAQSMVGAPWVGTYSYMAPEVWKQGFHRNSDQYSLAATFVELRLGCGMFPSKNMGDLMRAHTEDSPTLEPLPDKEKQVIWRALSKNPRDRFPSCLAFVEALIQSTNARPAPSAPSFPTFPDLEALPPPATHRWWLWVSLVLMATAATAYFSSLRTTHTLARNLTIAAPTTLVIPQGRQGKLQLSVNRENVSAQLNVSFANLPPKVESAPAIVPENEDQVTIPVDVLPGAATGKHTLFVHVEGDGVEQKAAVDLWVVFLPPDFEPIGEEIETPFDEGKRYFKGIATKLGGTPVEFLAIGRLQKTLSDGQSDPATYYIMKNKVSVGMFRKFANTHPEQVKNQDWLDVTPWDDQYPVLKVNVEDAYRFARQWPGGNLPTTIQWDKASGLFRDDHGEGPYRGKWKSDPRPIVAVNRNEPMPIGTARDDESLYGCRDMAGNGLEWTRNFFGDLPNKFVPLIGQKRGNEYVELRSEQFRGRETPYRFLPTGSAEQYDNTHEQLGFRVVIEP